MFRIALILTILLGLALPASAQTAPTVSLAAEADALAYGISGYSGIFSLTLPACATAPRLGRAAVWLAVISAAAMMTGLLRWSTLHWGLAQQWMSATPASRELLASRFATANFYLGNVIGEFAGELFLNGFFLTSALALAAGRRRRWLMFAGVAASALGWIAMLRNMTSLVAPVAALNNVVLPLWMLTLGVVLGATPVQRGDISPGPRHSRPESLRCL